MSVQVCVTETRGRMRTAGPSAANTWALALAQTRGLAGLVIGARRDHAPIHLDVIGVGASPYDVLNSAGQIVAANAGEGSGSAATAVAETSAALKSAPFAKPPPSRRPSATLPKSKNSATLPKRTRKLSGSRD